MIMMLITRDSLSSHYDNNVTRIDTTETDCVASNVMKTDMSGRHCDYIKSKLTRLERHQNCLALFSPGTAPGVSNAG